jgi:hypothetical protein
MKETSRKIKTGYVVLKYVCTDQLGKKVGVRGMRYSSHFQPFLQQASGQEGWEFPTKINSAEDGIDGTNVYFRQNSGYCMEQKIVRISFPTLFFRGRENNWEFQSVEQK